MTFDPLLVCASFVAVEQMRAGRPPEAACAAAIERIAARYPSFSGALVAATNKGIIGVCKLLSTIVMYLTYLGTVRL